MKKSKTGGLKIFVLLFNQILVSQLVTVVCIQYI